MPTYEQRELAGYLPVEPQRLPKESKHTLDDKRDQARLHRIEAKEIRLLDNNMMPYHQPLAEVLSMSPKDAIRHDLNNWEVKEISRTKAMHIPYKKYAS